MTLEIELPNGWEWAPLGEVVEILDNRRIPVNEKERSKRLESARETFPYYGATGQVGTIDGYLFEGPSVLLGEDGAPFLNRAKAKAYVVNGRYWVNNHAHILRGVTGVNDSFICHQLNAIDYHPYVSGTTRLKLTQGAMKGIRMAIAPSEEQKRIASKIDELFSRVDEGERALEQVSKLVERYRQSVLKAAITGELTRDWREARKVAGEPVESSEALLTRILSGRRDAWEQAELAKMQAKGTTPKDNKWKLKYKEPLPPDTIGLPDLPEGWVWASVDQVAADTLIGMDRGAAAQSAKPNGCPYVKMNNVTMRGEVRFDNVVYVKASLDEQRKFSLQAGDILFNTRNSKELVGKAGLVKDPLTASLYNNNLMRIRVVSPVDSRYVAAHMCEPRFRERLELVKKATTSVAAVYAKDLFPLALAIPPIDEQAAIYSEIARQTSLADEVEKEVNLRLSSSKALRQALLRSAFRGELVPQDSADEPASILLEHITAERVERNTAAHKRGRKKKCA